ncbi:MAG: hypothetical protein IKO72_06025 [Kiritimatiellae bacterium]|nr:hypothetical protein [Kiritimatiellia bacterium]
MNIEFKCPQCGQMVAADESSRGQVAECPHCGKGIVVPHGKSRLGVRKPPEAISRDHYQGDPNQKGNRNKLLNQNDCPQAKCPYCGAEYTVEKKDMYRSTICGVCGRKFIIGESEKQLDTPKQHAKSNLYSPYVPLGGTSHISEWKYFVAWLVYSLATIIAAVVFCGILGFILGVSGVDLDMICRISMGIGTFISMPIGYLGFRYIAITILNYYSKQQKVGA